MDYFSISFHVGSWLDYFPHISLICFSDALGTKTIPVTTKLGEAENTKCSVLKLNLNVEWKQNFRKLDFDFTNSTTIISHFRWFWVPPFKQSKILPTYCHSRLYIKTRPIPHIFVHILHTEAERFLATNSMLNVRGEL